MSTTARCRVHPNSGADWQPRLDPRELSDTEVIARLLHKAACSALPALDTPLPGFEELPESAREHYRRQARIARARVTGTMHHQAVAAVGGTFFSQRLADYEDFLDAEATRRVS